ncbi:PREDICTED: receptor-like protein 12 isoform X1 [Brassica oleracea var. oleracea]|uniref:receptor-like protein 12 isoform X1 n=1 Tax=Brassica oleracea var. oleracea TaxID=109376 RepID=UPI0006A6FCD5|nr:PREDICTED: receptor-like protein 12 isoform X1 [Brassica oleracea var. oleracea]
MMTRSHCYCFITIFFTLLLHTLASPPHHFCKEDQRDALLEFIAEFPTGESYTWNKSSDCCFWEGVTCNHRSGQVISLDLSYTLLNSSLKTNNSLFRLRSLRHLNLMDCNLRGEIPSSLGNLSRLVELDLWDNHLVGEVPVSVGNLNELRVLSLGGNKLSGNFPIIFANLTKLSFLGLNFNNFTSTLPVNMSEFINLEYFNINENSFFGPFPKSLFLNPLLESVDLGRNQFTGPFEFPNTSSLSSKLQFLNLANNRFDGPIPESISKFLHLSQIYLNHNNFSGSIPRSISKLANLTDLHLSNNMLKGRVPGFLWRLLAVTLSHNYFSSFANPSKDPLIQMLDLSSNSFQGPFPHWICKLKKLSLLDLSNNLFNGSIPPCLRNSTVSLIDLILRNNSFSGIIPDIFADATELQSFDVSRNHLEGSFPKSLIICKALQIVNVENNKIKDEFPFWLGSLPSLNVLILRSNEFYGPLYHPHMSIGFQSLKVIDVSHNEFTGTLPSHYFSNWREMTTSSEEIDQYYFASIGYTTPWNTYHTIYYESVYHSMEMVNKGVEMNFERILKDFRAINFSGNRISGEIPESISCLKELRLLNLSNNKFRNDIPRCISNLKNLETLDLSSNNLSGQIPQDLGNLSFLSYMNFSHNLLQGPVPRGTQFQRQKCSSFLDNPGLFGLEEICQQTHVPNPTSHQSEELSEAEEQVLNWIAAAIAYGPGLLCGLVMGHIFTSHNHQCWFAERFGRRKIRVVTSVR